jgi:hypothetical protein
MATVATPPPPVARKVAG